MKLRVWVVLSCLLAMVAYADTSGAVPAPDFTLPSRAGKNIRLAELRGNIILLNFWASWCGPCREEMPKLEALHQKYKDLGVKIVGVNLDTERPQSEPLLKDTGVTFTILFDTEGKVGEMFKVETMPSTYLIDRDGRIRYVHRGYRPGYENEYEAQIKALLRE
ncbi:MAG: TlpA family protein disulfide reductase [Gammaproteobacteria bacterium]|nr:MAG: TlpA family protein disulfide reductase [Gammaproteobacteria bacterium]